MHRLVALLCVFACATPVAARERGPAHLPLVDQTGNRFSLSDLSGRPTFVTFVATRCTDTCPIANAEFSRFAAELDRTRTRVNLVTVTLDPDYDTPFVLAREARRYGADARVWRFAGGTPRDVRSLMRAFGVVTERDRHGVPDVHTTFVYVLDRSGRLAHTLLLSTDFAREAAQLARERT